MVETPFFAFEPVLWALQEQPSVSLGILSTKEYVESSASGLVAQFAGQSGPQTRDVLTRDLGKVLFIDEAHRLCDGEFGREAVNELVDSLTEPQFIGKLVVTMAGYT